MPKDMLHLCNMRMTRTKWSLEKAMLYPTTHLTQESRHPPVLNDTGNSGSWTTMGAGCQGGQPITCLMRIHLVILRMDSKI
jgi:hypothetical protein